MSNNPGSVGNPNYPFLTLELKLPDGSIMTLGNNILVIDGSLVLLGRIAFIDMSAIDPRVPGSMPTIKAPIDDVISHTLNAGIPPNLNKQRTGLRYVDDPNPTGVRFCRVTQADYEKLKAWHDRHGATGGTDDDSQAPDPSKIPFPEWQPGPGKDGDTGTGGGAVVEPVEHPGKGEGDITIHAADKDANRKISREEKDAYERDHPGEKVKKGEY